jgi:predicted benzoate:H+ symporter BenE
VGLACAAVWVALGLASPLVIAALAALPAARVAGVVGIALLGSLTGRWPAP